MVDLNRELSNFFNLIKIELEQSKELYGASNERLLKAYYNAMLKPRNYYNYMRYFYIKRVLPLVLNIKKDSKILDAGCGLGTESLLFGLRGGIVIGIDIRKDRIDLAKKRKKYFEDKLKTTINLDFKFENIMSHSGKYDIIWANEAISHIDPLDKFLNYCHNSLNKNGKLIIVDANKLNPYLYYYAKKEQKKYGGITQIFRERDPITRDQISYAVERIFSVHSIKSILSKMFEIEEISLMRYVPFLFFTAFPKASILLEDMLKKIPIIKSFATLYVIICRKK